MKTIIFIDDDQLVTTLYKTRLTAEGFDVDIAQSGDEAILKLQQHCPDLVVLDLNMPGVSGVEVLRSIRSTPQLKHVPVIVFSTGYIQALVEEASRLGINAMFTKAQCPPTKLIAEIKELMKHESIPASALTVAASAPDHADERFFELLNEFSAEEDPAVQRKKLLIIYKEIQDWLHRAQQAGESTPCERLGRALERLFNDIYEQDGYIAAPTRQTLVKGIQRLGRMEMTENIPATNSEQALKDLLRSFDDE